MIFFVFQAEDGIRDLTVTGVQTCALPILKGHTITSWPTLRDDLENAGATWRDEECIRDRNWVSSRKPDDLPVFNREMVKLFAERDASKGLRADQRDELGVRA